DGPGIRPEPDVHGGGWQVHRQDGRVRGRRVRRRFRRWYRELGQHRRRDHLGQVTGVDRRGWRREGGSVTITGWPRTMSTSWWRRIATTAHGQWSNFHRDSARTS